MDRRLVLKGAVGSAAAAMLAAQKARAFGSLKKLATISDALPGRQAPRVAFMMGEGTNVIDLTGPWEVFQDVHLHETSGMRHPFDLFTVAPDLEARAMTGGFLTRAHYRFADAPKPDVIVIPSHRGSEESLEWLRSASAEADMTMSVCAGVFHLGWAGLLEGLSATTHQNYWDRFSQEFPKIELVRGARFVDNGRIASAGGLTSGIDLALHIVGRYFGLQVAEGTATQLVHNSDAWRS